MAWARLDDNAAFHPKVLKAGNEAFGAVMRMVAWCAQYGTDGKVPESVALSITGTKQLLDRLLASGFLDASLGCYVVHDFLHYNPSAAAVAKKREARAAAGRVGGERSGKTRREKAIAKAVASPRGEAKTNPVPDPDPDPIPDLKTSPKAGEAPASAAVELKEQAGRVWEHYRSRWADSRLPIDGQGPLMTQADFMIARRLVKQFGEDEAKALIDRYLDDSDGWLVKQGHPLKAIAPRVNAYRQRQGKRSAAPAPIGPIPEAEGGFSKL